MVEQPGTKERESTTIEDMLEFVPSILMAVAVVLTAYSAYEATRWGGVQATDFATASSLRIQAATETTIGVTQLSYDAGTFGQLALEFRGTDFSDPVEVEEAALLADALMRDEFKPYFEEWLTLEPGTNPAAPGTPFDLPSFTNERLDEAERLVLEAEVQFEEAKVANQNGDDYILATIFFAGVLFFSGVRVRRILSRGVVLALASAALITGMVWIAGLPFE